jgi:hypothetical protein
VRVGLCFWVFGCFLVQFLGGLLAVREPAGCVHACSKWQTSESGLKDPDGKDLFKDLFGYLRNSHRTAEAIYDDIVRRVFHANPGETLRAVELKAATGEIGLRAGADNPYFGVINIGDVAGLMKLLKAQGIPCEEENISGSLFDRINDPESPVNILIGSRKFMEGWDSFRVASMGLMNIGRGEGAQIIQLFGRGVRLWGKDRSLKRSKASEPNGAPPHIGLLETLNVFGIRANYMAQFREYLKQEGVTEFEEVIIPVEVQENFLNQGLQVLRLPNGKAFEEQEGVVLGLDEEIHITLDLRPQLEVAQSDKGDETVGKAGGTNKAEALKKELASLLNWQRIYFDLLEFRRVKGLYNLSFTLDTLREILEKGNYTVLCSDDQLSPRRFTDLRRAEEVAVSVLRKYITAFYDRQRRAWERRNLQLVPLTRDNPTLKWNERQDGKPYYTLKIARERRDFLAEVRQLVEKADKLYQQDVENFLNIHFDCHLYQPLLLAHPQIDAMTPPGLNEGEAKFVRDLREYLQKNSAQLQGKKIFLLRNLTRGRGIGFFDAKSGEAFYPDFILWVIEGNKQRIAFIDPHGLRMAQGGFNDPKICLHKELEQLSEHLRHTDGKEHLRHTDGKWCVYLTSFILSTSPYEEVRRAFGTGEHEKNEFYEEHVLFQEDTDYIGQLLCLLCPSVSLA